MAPGFRKSKLQVWGQGKVFREGWEDKGAIPSKVDPSPSEHSGAGDSGLLVGNEAGSQGASGLSFPGLLGQASLSCSSFCTNILGFHQGRLGL